MQNNDAYNRIRELEVLIDNAFPLIPGRLAIAKTKEILSQIDTISNSLPPEIQEAYSKGMPEQPESVPELLRFMKITVNEGKSFFFGSFVLIKPDKILVIIDKIYSKLPIEVNEARKFLGINTEFSDET